MAIKKISQLIDNETIKSENHLVYVPLSEIVDNASIFFYDGHLTTIAPTTPEPEPEPSPEPTPETSTYDIPNTVWKDADGNVVAEGADGAKQYKVLTFWCEGGLADGLEWLGLSNSEWCATGANGTQDIETWTGGDDWDSALATIDNMAILWLCTASKYLNAYDRNYLYNLWVSFDPNLGRQFSDWAATNFPKNRWDASAGCFTPLKYRPALILAASEEIETFDHYSEMIRDGEYTPTEGGDPDPDGYDSEFGLYEDSNYQPSFLQHDYIDPFSQLNALHPIAKEALQWMETTSEFPGIGDEDLDWKTAQQLPQTNRKSLDPTDIACYAEALIKGAIGYTRKCITDSTTYQKRVHFLHALGNAEATLNIIHPQFCCTSTGHISFAALLVEDPLDSGNRIETQIETDPITSITIPTYFENVDADYLCDADCLVIEDLDISVEDLREWLKNFVSSRHVDVDGISLCGQFGNNTLATNSITNLSYGLYLLEFIYPELFSGMQLSCFFWDVLASIKESSLNVIMQTQYASFTLPPNVDLTNIPVTYSRDEVWDKLVEGLNYWHDNEDTDELFVRLKNNNDTQGATEMNGIQYNFESFELSDQLRDWFGF